MSATTIGKTESVTVKPTLRVGFLWRGMARRELTRIQHQITNLTLTFTESKSLFESVFYLTITGQPYYVLLFLKDLQKWVDKNQ